MNVNSIQPWELDTRHLLALTAIARTRSVSRAAEELGYGQSAVSQQLAALERTVGARLVDRGTGPKPVTLTEAGQLLLPHAHHIIARLSSAQCELRSLTAGTSGSIRIGTFQSAGARLLPQVLTAYRAAWPEITVQLHSEVADSELSNLLRDGSLDVAFIEEASLGNGLDQIELLVDRFVALVPPQHRLATRKIVSLHDFEGEDVIDGETGDTCTLRAVNALRDAGVTTNVVFRTDDNTTRQRLVDAGLGCAVLPDLAVEPSLTSGAVVIPIKERFERHICLAWPSDRTLSKAMTTFIDTAKRELIEPCVKPVRRGRGSTG
jgi:DNA-binding transcriptional LysR family regulator